MGEMKQLCLTPDCTGNHSVRVLPMRTLHSNLSLKIFMIVIILGGTPLSIVMYLPVSVSMDTSIKDFLEIYKVDVHVRGCTPFQALL